MANNKFPIGHRQSNEIIDEIGGGGGTEPVDFIKRV